MKYKKIALGVVFSLFLILLAFKPLSKGVVELYLAYKLDASVTIKNYQLFPLTADLFITNLKLGDDELQEIQTKLKFSGDRVITHSSLEDKKLRTKDLSFEYNLKSGDFQAKSDLEIVGFDSLHLQTQGNYQEDNLSADINGTFAKKSDFNFVANLNKEGNVTKVDLDANTFGGVLEVAFAQEKLTLFAKSLQLSKIFQELKQEPIAQGKLNLQATLDIKTLHTQLVISSQKIVALKQSFEDVKFRIQDFSYEKENLHLQYGLNFTQNKKQLHFNGSANYKDTLQLSADTKDFGGEIAFTLNDTNLSLNASKVLTQNILVFLGQKSYLSGEFDLHAKGDFKNIDIELKAPQLKTSQELLGKEENLSVKFLANYKPTKVTFTPYLKSSMIEFGKGDGSYEIEKKRLHLKQNLRVKYKKTDAPIYVEVNSKDGVVQLNTPSLGGETKIIFKDENLYVQLKRVNIKTLDKIFLQKNILKKGTLNGKLFYDIKHKKGSSVLRVDNAIVKGVDLDAKLGTLMNAMGLNIFSLKDELFDNNKKIETKIRHLEFDVTLENEKIHLVDSAFATPKFRIAALGNVAQNGKIEELNLNLLDKNGCSIIKQDISGTLSDPILENKILTTADVVVSIPGEVLKSPKKLLDMSTNMVDKTATFLLGVTHLSDSKVTVTSDIKNRVSNLVEDTSKIVLKECKVVYDGKVKAIEVRR